ncbi:alkaline phosphatase family protein [Mucisphaera calidilacus]|uniref:Type I phosphodiesterase / nucleotide pyrophosphatase n=1 Tax=Mucisphaera calidilacus TaxID=2527982 RepID=A0A518BZW5_9BACT|nr:alkaline phosphatase family protein [Mucisphaera calidilacus]QDU72511.1 Type I phosphodiesterase / nucleotide pyrophosphatase [Mucisphaera calidilacus]
MTESKPRVLLIGWDAADWRFVDPLIDRGLMPTLASLRERGAWGKIATLQPMLSPMLWTSIATGKAARHHGICGFTEPLPDGSGIRPVSSVSRRCQAVWNILTQKQLRSHVVGWYASHPAEPINGTMVSNQFELPVGPAEQPWPVPPGAVHPADLSDVLAPLRVHPGEMDANAVLPLIPNAARDQQREGHRLGKAQSLLAQTVSIHTVATHLMMQDDWDFMAVYYEGIDRFAHEFMEFHPPRMDHVSDEDFENYQHVMTGVYRFHDMMLETLLKLAGEGTTVILMSDHGYLDDASRPNPDHAGPVDWHRPLGMVCVAGPSIKRGTRLFGPTLLDVTPTILRLFDLPVGADMPGRAWVEAMEDPTEPGRILSWESPSEDDGRHPADVQEDPESARAALQQLIDLGYVDPPGEDVAQTVADTRAHNDLTLARSMLSMGDTAEALEVLESLPTGFRNDAGIRAAIAQARLLCGDLEGCKAELDALADEPNSQGQRYLLLGAMSLRQGEDRRALEHYETARTHAPDNPALLSRLAGLQLRLGRPEKAAALYRQAIERAPEDATSWDGLAEAHLRLGENKQALDAALEAVGLAFGLARAHLRLSKALLAVGDTERAAEAVEACLIRSHGFVEAHEHAVAVYETLGDTDRANEHRRLADKARVARSSGS